MGFMSTLVKSRAALVGAWVMAAASFSGVGAAYAQDAQAINVAATTDTSDVTLDTDCNTYRVGEFLADNDCEIAKGKILDQQLREKEAAYFAAVLEVAAAGDEPRCTRALSVDLKMEGRITKPLTEVPAKGTRCDTLRGLVTKAMGATAG